MAGPSPGERVSEEERSLRTPGVLEPVPGVEAAFTTRRGGVSAGPYRSLNLGLSTDDPPDRVRTNRGRVCRAMGFDAGELAVAGQVHGARVRRVARPGLHPGCDGLVTDRRGLLLAISAADCAAVLLADESGSRVGACHAGWRGALAGIVGRTVEMLGELGVQSDRLRAYVSPCISAARFEVGPEVAGRFEAAHVLRRPGWERPHVDLKGCIHRRLREAGLTDSHIEVAPECTVEERELFYSYRRDGAATGRMMGLIGMRTTAEH